jgi:polyisoprenoid-binding protein YceI
MVGHDLVIEATSWRGTVTVPEGGQPQIAVEVDVRSLEVREGLRGAKPLTDKDVRDIKETMADLLGAEYHPLVSYVSDSVQVAGGTATADGQLTLLGITQPLRLDLQAHDGMVTATAAVQQSLWGIKPYGVHGCPQGPRRRRGRSDCEARVGTPRRPVRTGAIPQAPVRSFPSGFRR